MSSNDQYAPDPRYSGLYQRGGDSAGEPGGHVETPRPSHEPGPSPRPAPASPPSRREDTSLIREIGAEDRHELPPEHHRNPFDAWIWGVATALLALGLFVIVAPALYADTLREQMLSGMYLGHWSQQIGSVAAPLILVGSATAVAQLFILSHRRHRRTR